MTDAGLPDWPALMDEGTAAAYLSLSTGSLQTLVAKGRLHAARMEVRLTRYRRRDLDAYVDSLPLREVKLDAESGESEAGAAPPLDPAEEGLRRVEAMASTRGRRRGRVR